MRRKIEVEELTCDGCHKVVNAHFMFFQWSQVTFNKHEYDMCEECSAAIKRLQHFMILLLDLHVSLKPLGVEDE